MFGLVYTKNASAELTWFDTKEELMETLAGYLAQGYEASDFAVFVEYSYDEFITYF